MSKKIDKKYAFPKFIQKAFGFFASKSYQYNSVIKISLFKPIFLLTHPDDIKYVLLTNAKNYLKTPNLVTDEGKKRVGSGLLSSSGNNHKTQRKLLQPIFRNQSISTFIDTIQTKTTDRLEQWVNTSKIEIADEMTTLSQSILIGSLLGKNFQDKNNQFAKSINDRRLFTEKLYYSKIPWATFWPTKTVKNNKKAKLFLVQSIVDEIEKRRKYKQSLDDLLGKMMDATYEDNSFMDDNILIDEALSLTQTGYETIAESLTWTIYLIAKHPEVKEKIKNELQDVLKNKPANFVDLHHLPYLEMVLAESLRLYPPTWIYVRTPITDDILPSGKKIKTNSILYLSQYLMHRHPDYFENPEDFIPERFANDTWRKSIYFTYFPFGIGAHKCIGDSFAKIEIMLILSLIFQKFDVKLLDNKIIIPNANVTLRPLNKIFLKLIHHD